MKKSFFIGLTKEIFGKYTWCLHCERVFLTEDWEKHDWFCPANDCDGGGFDAWKWSEVRRENTSYPEVPVVGGYYPLYGNKEMANSNKEKS